MMLSTVAVAEEEAPKIKKRKEKFLLFIKSEFVERKIRRNVTESLFPHYITSQLFRNGLLLKKYLFMCSRRAGG